MQFPRSIFCCIFLTLAMLIASNAFSYDQPANSLRFSFGVWDMSGKDVGITVDHTYLDNNERLTDVLVSGISGSFAYSHMVGDKFAWELSMGGFSDSESTILGEEVNIRHRDDYYDTIYSYHHSVNVSYIMMGLIYYPLNELHPEDQEASFGGLGSFIRPYISAGIGPYFGWEAIWDDDDMTDAEFATTLGAYPGAGLDIVLHRNFIINIDFRYHFVKFSEELRGEKDYSGLNTTAGFKVAF